MKPFLSTLRTSRLALFVLLILATLAAGCRSGSSEQRFLDRAKKLIEQKHYDRAILELRNAARLQPKSAEVYYQAGLAYLAIGDYRTAYGSLVRATELNPNLVAAQNKLAELIGSSVADTRDPRALEGAEQRVQSVLAIVPDSGEALNALGVTDYLLGKPEDAIKHLETALEKSPQNLKAAWSLAVIKVRQKDFTGAEQILKKAAADSPKSTAAQVALARFLVVAQRQAEAEATYHRALKMDPKYGPALLDLARLQVSLGRKEEAEKTLAALSELPDKEYRPLHGTYLFAQGRRDEALKEFEKQAAEDRNDRAAFTRLTSAYFVARRFPDAERTVNAALKRNAKDTTALLERSRLYLVTAKFSEAESDLNRVLKFDPNLANARYLLSKVFSARGQPIEARQQLILALDSRPDLLAARLELAQGLIAGGGARAALDLLNRAPEKQKNLPATIAVRNAALFATGDKAELRKSLAAGLSSSKRAPDLVLQDALLKVQERDMAGARKSLEEVLAVRPEDAVALDALAKTYVFERHPDLALRTVEQYADRRPNSGPLQNLLGDWMAQNKRRDDARKAYKAALAADPSLIRARMSLGLIDAAEGRFDSARETMASAAVTAATPSIRAQVEAMLGELEEKAGNPSAGIPHYRKALEADPNNLTALNNLAYLLANGTDQIDEALKCAQKAKELDPNAWAVEDTIGWAFYRKGLYDSAVIHLRNAVRREPTAVRKYHLGMAWLRAGDQQHGRQVLDEARRMNPNLPEAAAASKLMANLGGAN